MSTNLERAFLPCYPAQLYLTSELQSRFVKTWILGYLAKLVGFLISSPLRIGLILSCSVINQKLCSIRVLLLSFLVGQHLLFPPFSRNYGNWPFRIGHASGSDRIALQN